MRTNPHSKIFGILIASCFIVWAIFLNCFQMIKVTNCKKTTNTIHSFTSAKNHLIAPKSHYVTRSEYKSLAVASAMYLGGGPLGHGPPFGSPG